jgi:DNA invertase Pin-like site-specific DNA recombinase
MRNIPAAQYIRVSTDRQEYSIDCQMAEISKYARRNSFEVVHTYCDRAKSGLLLKRRTALAQLLQDAVAGKHLYQAILVYDVSRWGRFQDPDEAAHYEFICKAAGVPVHYCAEHFSNDGYLPNLILKTLKRVMAGEYSRELSDKVFAALIRNAKKGFRVGGRPGYGLRRTLVSKDGIRRQELDAGQWKSVTNERVVLSLGPEQELQWVREIYRMYISGRFSMQDIADELNRQGAPIPQGVRIWSHQNVSRVLTHPKYEGTAIYNRTSAKLRGPKRATPESEWVVLTNAFPAIVDAQTFEAAQQIRRRRLWNPSDGEVLAPLKGLLSVHGRLSSSLIRTDPTALSPDAYRRRFGTLTNAFALVGYESPRRAAACTRMAIQQMRAELINRIIEIFPNEVFVHYRGPIQRNCLRLKSGRKIAVHVCRSKPAGILGHVWMLHPPGRDKGLISLMAGASADNKRVEVLYILPPFSITRDVQLSSNHKWLRNTPRLASLDYFCDELRLFVARREKTLYAEKRTPKHYFPDDVIARISMARRLHWARLKGLPDSEGIEPDCQPSGRAARISAEPPKRFSP